MNYYLFKLNRYFYLAFLLFGAINAISQTKQNLLPSSPQIHHDLIHLDSKKSKNLTFSSPELQIHQDYVAIDLVAVENAEDILDDLLKLGLKETKFYQKKISGYLPIKQIPELHNVEGLKIASPTFKPQLSRNTGSVIGQGAQALQTNLIRNTFNLTGKGIKIGVLSDSYNNLGGALNGISSGDLPEQGVEVLTDLNFGGFDEGRAMLEIIHDIAPDAELFFRTGVVSDVDFTLGIFELAEAGCDIILDDITYLNQPFFQNGIIASAVDSVHQMGIAFFSSVGNTADNSYESNYIATVSSELNTILEHEYLDYHTFSSDDLMMQVILAPEKTLRLSFQWSDPFFSISGGNGAQSDLDIFLLDKDKNIVAQSIENNIGNDPIEIILYENTSNTSLTLDLVIARKEGAVPDIIKYIDFTGLETEYETSASTIFGHVNTNSVCGVGAVPWFSTPVFGVDPPQISASSAQGGTPILYDTMGSQINLMLQKPNITAPDGVNTTFFGDATFDDGDEFPNFFGTSAAVPHVAATAALMLEAVGRKEGLSPKELFDILQSTAIDMESVGFDYRTGFGFLNAFEAVKSAITQSIIINELDVDSPGEDNAEFIELYDGGYGNIPLDNLNLIFYDPETLLSTQGYSLDGLNTDANGFYVLGGPQINQVYGSGTADIIISNLPDFIPNQPGIIVLARGSASAYPIQSPFPDSEQILDMFYFAQNGFENLNISIEGITCVNEGYSNDVENHSLQRISNDNTKPNTFVTYSPTPGLPNNPPPSTILSLTPASLDFGRVNIGESSDVMSYQIRGEWLSTDTLYFLAPEGFEISFDENTAFSDKLYYSDNLKPRLMGLIDISLYVRFSPNSTINGLKNGQIIHKQSSSTLALMAVKGIETGNVTPISSIDSLRNLLDENLLPNYKGNVKVRGVIHGVNLQNPNYQFTIIEGNDEKDGIGIFIQEEEAILFNIKEILDSTEQGDEIVIEGVLGSNFGLMQIIQPVSFQIINERQGLQTPVTVNELNENTESRLVRLENVIISNPNEWLGGSDFTGDSFTFQVVNQGGTHVIRIDADSPLARLTFSEVFNNKDLGINIIGLGTQFDESNPRDSGYELIPFSIDQISISKLRLVVASINNGINPEVGLNFGVKVQVQDAKGSPAIVRQNTAIKLELNNGTGELTGNLEAFINAGADCVQLSGLSYGFAESGLSLGVKVINGSALESGESIPFAVTPVIDLSTIQMQVFPNPIEDKFRLELKPTISRKAILAVYGHKGKVYVSQEIDIQEGIIESDLAFLPPGIYILRIIFGKESVSQQIIKW